MPATLVERVFASGGLARAVSGDRHDRCRAEDSRTAARLRLAEKSSAALAWPPLQSACVILREKASLGVARALGSDVRTGDECCRYLGERDVPVTTELIAVGAFE